MTLVELPEKPKGGVPNSYYRQVRAFANGLREFDDRVDQEVSARGYAYLLENEGFITKSQIDYAEKIINKCRKNDFGKSAPFDNALLPTDFTAKDDARNWYCDDDGSDYDGPDDYISRYADTLLDASTFDRSFWEYQDFHLQVLVEKIDLVHLFRPICEKYNIPITTGKGWSTINQRAEIASRCYHWAEKGKVPVILYCGDFDPPGLRISDQLQKNLNDLHDAMVPLQEKDRYLTGFHTSHNDVQVERFGLNHDFIDEHDLTWVDNLETGSGKNLASPTHTDYDKDYVQDWLQIYGERKVEANALVAHPEAGRELFEDTIKSFLGDDPLAEYEDDLDDDRDEIYDRLDELGVAEPLEDALEVL